MKLNTYDIPDMRLIPTTVSILEEIYKIKKKARVPSKELAILLGFKYGTEAHFYRKIHALSEYGLIEGKGIFEVSDLGEKILHPRSEQEKALSITTAVLNVPLWKEIYQKQGKTPREDNFWAVLVDITKVDPDTAKTHASKLLKWYQEDIGHVSDHLVGQNMETQEGMESKTLSSNGTNTRSMSEQLLLPTDPNALGVLSVKGIGNIDLTDEDSITLAESALKILRKKLPTMTSKHTSTNVQTE